MLSGYRVTRQSSAPLARRTATRWSPRLATGTPNISHHGCRACIIIIIAGAAVRSRANSQAEEMVCLAGGLCGQPRPRPLLRGPPCDSSLNNNSLWFWWSSATCMHTRTTKFAHVWKNRDHAVPGWPRSLVCGRACAQAQRRLDLQDLVHGRRWLTRCAHD